jgi:hypothetical protein
MFAKFADFTGARFIGRTAAAIRPIHTEYQ